MKKLLIFFVSIALFTLFTNAQNEQIAGAVFGGSGTPVESASVFMFDADSVFVQTVMTDSTGVFTFSQNIKPPFWLKITHLNFIDFEQKYADTNVGAIFLQAKEQKLKEIVVRGEKPLVSIKNGILNYDMQQLIENKPVTNVYEALQKLPGVREENENLTLAGAGSFTVLINGKPSTMSQEQVYQLLKAMPATSLDRAEVMYSAPPQYHAGNGAAINIITKKGLLNSINGQANAGYTQKFYSNFNAGASVFYNSDKIYSDFLYSFSRSKNRSGLDLYSTHTLDNQIYNIEQHNIGYYTASSHTVRAGLDYNFTEKRTLSAVYTMQTVPKMYGESSADGSFGKSSDYDGKQNSSQMQNVGLHYNAQDWGFTAGANFTSYSVETESIYQKLNSEFSLLSQQNVSRLQSYIDKTHELKYSWTVGYGAQFNFARNHSLQHYSQQIDADYNDSQVSQKEYTYSAYARFSKTFSQQFNLSASLQGEYYKYGEFQRFNFYPQITSAWYSKDYNHIFQLNFTAIKNYPQYFEMSNFTAYINDYAVAWGNPNLLPSIRYSGTLTYVLLRKYNFTLFNIYADKYFVQLPYQSTRELKLIYQTTNFDFQQQTGISVSAPLTVKFYDATFNIQAYYQRAKNSHFHDIAFDARKFSLYASLDNNFTISQKPNLKFNIQGTAITNTLQGAGVIPATAWLNSGLKWIFANRKAELNLRANDIFNSQPRGMIMNYGTQNFSFYTIPDNRNISLSFVYKFGADLTPRDRKEVDTSRFGVK